VVKEYYQRTWALFEDIQTQLVNEQFDLVLVCRGLGPLMPWEDLQAHYVCAGPLPAPMTFGYWLDSYPLEAWVPRSRLRRSD